LVGAGVEGEDLGGRENEMLGLVMGDSAMVLRGLALSPRAAPSARAWKIGRVYTVWRFGGKFCAARQGFVCQVSMCWIWIQYRYEMIYFVYPGRPKLYAGWLRRKEERKPAP
jgi:hypothetical protein